MYHSGERLVVALRTDGDHDAAVLAELEPLYVSETTEQAALDFQLLFPPADDEATEPNETNEAAPEAEE